jgi:hypothetical protein
MQQTIGRLSRHRAVQAAAWTALNGLLAVLFALLLFLDDAHAAGL